MFWQRIRIRCSLQLKSTGETKWKQTLLIYCRSHMYTHTHNHLSSSAGSVLIPQRLIQQNAELLFFIIILLLLFFSTYLFSAWLYDICIPVYRCLHSLCSQYRYCLFMHRVCICVHFRPARRGLYTLYELRSSNNRC